MLNRNDEDGNRRATGQENEKKNEKRMMKQNIVKYSI